MISFTYDDSQLMKLFEELSPKNRKKALKSAMTRAGGQVRKEAIKNLQGATNHNGVRLKTDSYLGKGIRRINYKKVLGFRVTIGSKRRNKSGSSVWTDYSYHLNHRGNLKPVLIWAEGGTVQRRTRTFRHKFKQLNRGRMDSYGFIEKTKKEMSTKVEEMMKSEIVNSIQRIARKYGCTVR